MHIFAICYFVVPMLCHEVRTLLSSVMPHSSKMSASDRLLHGIAEILLDTCCHIKKMYRKTRNYLELNRVLPACPYHLFYKLVTSFTRADHQFHSAADPPALH